MKKLTGSFPFVSLSDRSVSGVPLNRQIYKKMRQAILLGEIPAKSRVPSSRVLARQLGVSRTTVLNAYDQLFAEGYLENRIGAGTFVASELPEKMLHAPKIKAVKSTVAAFSRDLNFSRQGSQMSRALKTVMREHSANKPVPFRNGSTAIDRFPFDTWARIAARWNRHAPTLALGNDDSAGFYPLRASVAAHLKSVRGVVCEPEQVIITAGAQQALSLIAAVFLERGDEVWMEDPGYTSARSLFALSGTKLIPVPVDEDGLSVKAALRQSKKPKLIYVTPSRQYPLGATMSVARRLSLIETARAAGAWIIEDDYDSEFRYAGRPLASLQGLDRNGRVLYVGTFSKTIFPSLRLGCLVVPPDLVEVFTAARMLHGAHSPLIEQAILAEFISEGHFARHVRRMRMLYEERQQILVEEVGRNLKGLLEMKAADAGMHLVGWLPDDFVDREAAQKAEAENIKLSSISEHSINKYSRGGLIFGYAAFDEKQIRSGIIKLAEILTEMARNRKDSVQRKPLAVASGNSPNYASY